MPETKTTQFEFQAEIRQLLDILVHSLYAHREVFLRELISNASDALDKLRFESTRGGEVADPGSELEIRIDPDKERKTLTVRDTGIGMTRDEVIRNIGTIARSGSAEFLARAAGAGTSTDAGSIIGKFGVGFYAVFMAAREVVLHTRSATPGEAPVTWRSEGLGVYEIGPGPEDLPRGTRIELHLRDEAAEFLEPHRLRSIIQKHSNFISFPIYVSGDRVNTVSALWREPKFKVKKEQYEEFYRFLTHETGAPFETLHQSVDAPVQFHSLLFIPPGAEDPFASRQEDWGLDLYARRVLIQHRNKELIPEYLGFLRGVVDSEDLPLNISRETLQPNTLLVRIGQTITKNVLAALAKIAKDEPARYAAFWTTHGRRFKLGYQDWPNREAWADLLRFHSSRSGGGESVTSLAEYAARLKPDQQEIYYASGPSREALRANPHLDPFRAKGIEVLYLLEPVDEFALEALGRYRDYPLRSAEHADPKALEKFQAETARETPPPLSTEDQARLEELRGRLREILGDRVTDVRVSARLHESPCCLVNPDGMMTSSMQKVLQILNKDGSIPKKVFEFNPDHRIFRNLLEVFKRDAADPYLALAVEQLYEGALLMDGYLRDPHEMVGRMQELIGKSGEWYLAVRR